MSMAEIGLVLAAFRSDHGAYPNRLGELVPAYLSTIPKDLFADNELHYSAQGEGYELYSVGPNTKDDGGHDRNDNPPGDDIVIRLPSKTIAVRMGFPCRLGRRTDLAGTGFPCHFSTFSSQTPP